MRAHRLGLLLLVCPLLAAANDYAAGDVFVVEDTDGSIHSSPFLQSSFCQAMAHHLYAQYPDQYDGIFSFTREPLNAVQQVQQGTPVRWSEQGLGYQGFDQGAAYGSPARLSQCVFMASLGGLPTSPYGLVQLPFGGFSLGITGVELMGHEYGHHWLLWVTFNKNDGLGDRDLLRGWESGSNPEGGTDMGGGPNGHWSYYANSSSPMYGSFLTDLGNGQYLAQGGDRKYTELDQYLMGLRDKAEVGPMWALDDGSGHGNASLPLKKGDSATLPMSGFGPLTRVDFTIDDVIRSVGARVPAYPNTQRCWRVAFVLGVGQGNTASPAELAMVESYRQALGPWFSAATDGRGTMDTRLTGVGCLTPPPDGGTGVDAGAPDAGEPDGGSDGGELTGTGGGAGGGSGGGGGDGGTLTKDDTRIDTGKLRPGCGCSSYGSWAALLGLLLLLTRAYRPSAQWRRPSRLD